MNQENSTIPSQYLNADPSQAESGTSDPYSDFGIAWIIVPLLLLSAVTILCTMTSFDIYVSSFFYSQDAQKWIYKKSLFSEFIYHISPIPGIVLGVGCLILGLVGFIVPKIQAWSRPALFFALVLILGPAILINTVMKPTWGRPRPSKITEFNGKQEFVAPGQIGPYEKARSFPSGHASMGFVFMAPAFYLFRKKRKAAIAWLIFGISCGAIIGYSRISDGSHFFSDIAWSCGIVYFSGLLLYSLLRGWLHPHDTLNDPSSKHVKQEGLSHDDQFSPSLQKRQQAA